MFKVTEYPHGTFSWADCSSTDVEKSKAFFTGLMGWGMQDFPMGEGRFYTFFKQDGEDIAGISPMPAEMQGMPSLWLNYVSVTDVDALIDRIKALGGTVMGEPFDVFDNGRMLMLQDPTGADICLWQPRTHIGATLVNVPGAMSWNELATSDMEKAKDFYGKLLGWEFVAEDSDYYSILNNGRSNGGITQITPEMGAMPSSWSTYFSVSDIDEAVSAVNELGGSVIMPIVTAPGVGRFTTIADPTGAVCKLVQLEQAQPWSA